jgi:hypothetical protein
MRRSGDNRQQLEPSIALKMKEARLPARGGRMFGDTWGEARDAMGLAERALEDEVEGSLLETW